MSQCVIAAAEQVAAVPVISVAAADVCCDLLELLAEVRDGRSSQGRDHPAAVVLALAAAATVAGMRGYTAIAGWVADVPAAVVRELYLRVGATPAGRPSRSTIWRVCTDADAQRLDAVVGAWLFGQVAGDAEGEVPAFSDARVRDLLAAARQAGLRPRSDDELLPLLLDLIGAHIPVEAWPTRMGKTERTAQARDATQARAAATDRPDADLPPARPKRVRPAPVASPHLPHPPEPPPEPPAEPAGWRQRAGQAQRAADDDRAHRRRQALAEHDVTPPARLGDGFRRRNLFLLPAEDTDQDAAESDEDAPESGQAGWGVS
jgi:hypothetical protein